MQREPAFGGLEKCDPTIGRGRAYALSLQKIKLLKFGRNAHFVRRNTARKRDGLRYVTADFRLADAARYDDPPARFLNPLDSPTLTSFKRDASVPRAELHPEDTT
jgi:hypothetical protein